MRQVAQSIWNQIAKRPEMRYPAMKRLFSMKPEQVDAILDEQAEKLEAAGEPDSVILGYQLVAPLLFEREAIQAFVLSTESFGLRSALPEILSVDEGVRIAAMEYRLTDQEMVRLQNLLEASPDN